MQAMLVNKRSYFNIPVPREFREISIYDQLA